MGKTTSNSKNGKKTDQKVKPKPMDEMPDYIKKIIEERKKVKKVNDSTLRILEGKHVLSMILYIDENSPVMKTDIYSEISRSAGMSDKLDSLREAGLIEIYGSEDARTDYIILTEKGKNVASKIRLMLELIDSNHID